jgi:hypothetical protein
MVNGFPHMIDRSVVRRGTCALALVTAFAISAAAQAPALGDIAKKEAERRKALPPSGKVYTNKDLPESARKPAPSPGPVSTPAEAAAPAERADVTAPQPGSEQPAKAETEQKDEAWWKARNAGLQEDLRRNQLFAQALQSRINALTRDFTNASNGPRQRQIGDERREAMAELDRVLQELEAGKQRIADLEEEARKAGVPASWLR